MNQWYKPFFYKGRETLRALFSLRYLGWHVLAITLTFLIVTTGTDWAYFGFSRLPRIQSLAWPAALIGFFVPLLLPMYFLSRTGATRVLGYAVVQAQVIGWCLSAFYKALTGRAHPPLPGVTLQGDLTHIFQFGILKGGVFWGWPSSHATVACALSAVVFILCKKPWVRVLAVAYALYISLGASLSFHWLSDAVAGIIFGTLVGVLVARKFKTYTSPAVS